MKKTVLLAGLFSLSLITNIIAEQTTALIPGEKPGAIVTDTISAKATVTSIDYKTREFTIKGEDGESMTTVAGPEIVNFPQIKKGDIVVVDYLESVALFVRAPGEASPVSDAAAVAVAAPGQKPAINVAQSQEITATVLKVNSKTRELVLKGQDGTKRTVKCGPEVKRFDQIKKGDQVVSRITTAVAIAVRKP